MAPRVPDDAVQHGEVELPFPRLDLGQETPARTVLTFRSTSLDQTGCMCSTLVALLLFNSPASARNGLPSTISWVAVPCFRSEGCPNQKWLGWICSHSPQGRESR